MLIQKFNLLRFNFGSNEANARNYLSALAKKNQVTSLTRNPSSFNDRYHAVAKRPEVINVSPAHPYNPIRLNKNWYVGDVMPIGIGDGKIPSEAMRNAGIAAKENERYILNWFNNLGT